LVDTPDSKSGASDSVPVQVRPPVPNLIPSLSRIFFYSIINRVFLIHFIYSRAITSKNIPQ